MSFVAHPPGDRAERPREPVRLPPAARASTCVGPQNIPPDGERRNVAPIRSARHRMRHE